MTTSLIKVGRMNNQIKYLPTSFIKIRKTTLPPNVQKILDDLLDSIDFWVESEKIASEILENIFKGIEHESKTKPKHSGLNRLIYHWSGYLKINNSTNIIIVIFINYLMDTQLKIFKYPIENYNGKLWYPTGNTDTQFTQCPQILIWSYE